PQPSSPTMPTRLPYTTLFRSRHYQKLGLIWFDAHADFNTPEISPSGNVHGMPMAGIMGYGPTELTHILGFSPKIQPQHAVMVGIDRKSTRLNSSHQIISYAVF